ncbi:hypothetical protein JCM18899A_45600 [Nocardioides sp. AN3]
MSAASTVVLDATALASTAAEDRISLEWVKAALRADRPLCISAVTIAEVTDGSSRDTRVRRLVNQVTVHDVTPAIAHAAGAMRARVRRRKQRDLTVDAVVAATAASLPGPVVVLTSDPDDLTALLEGTTVRVASLS